MARKPNYKFERMERDRAKAARKQQRAEAKEERRRAEAAGLAGTEEATPTSEDSVEP